MKIFDVSKGADNLFGHAISEQLVFGICTEIEKRQHRNGSLHSGCRRRFQKSILSLGQGFYEARTLRGIAQRFPQLVDGFIEAVIEINKGKVYCEAPRA